MTGNNLVPILVTERDRQLLVHLSEAKLLDREQIQQLLNFGSVTRANDRLSRLHAAGLLYRYFVGTTAGGRKALYAISPRGAATIGREMIWKLHRAQDELLVGETGIEHRLAVNWCWISLKCGPDCDLIRFVRFTEPISPSLPLSPDGYAELRVSDGIQSVFLEVDLTTETSRVWDRKVQLYLQLATSGEFKRLFHQQRFKVAVVCTTKRRLDGLRRVVRKHTTKLFYFALLENIKRDGWRASSWLRPEGDAPQPIA
jgi:predicted transcriptional regulator